MTKKQLAEKVAKLEKDLAYSEKFIQALMLTIQQYNQRQTDRQTLVEFFHGE